MKVMVTGGAGFIGSHIVDSLLAKGYRVVIYDNFSSGTKENIEHIDSKNLDVVEGDILDFEKLSSVMEGCDYVSHHAAQLEIFLAYEDPLRDLEVNTIGTLNVIRAAKEAGVRKVINASSACVYGQTNEPSKESDDPTPNWDYGVSKLAAEKYGRIYSDYKGLPVVSLRYAIVYGEREWFRRVLPIFIKRVLNQQSPVVFGSGDQIRDFIYVGDVVELHNLCLEEERANGHVFNVGTGAATSVESLAEMASKLGTKELPVIYEETKEGEFSALIEGKRRNSSELKTMLLDMSKVHSVLGWQPSVKLQEGLYKEYVWAKSNITRWDKIYTTRW